MSRLAVTEAVSGCLASVLDAGSEEERRAAEQEMKALEVTEGMRLNAVVTASTAHV